MHESIVFCSTWYVHDVVVKKVHVRYLISWWVSCYMSGVAWLMFINTFRCWWLSFITCHPRSSVHFTFIHFYKRNSYYFLILIVTNVRLTSGNDWWLKPLKLHFENVESHVFKRHGHRIFFRRVPYHWSGVVTVTIWLLYMICLSVCLYVHV